MTLAQMQEIKLRRLGSIVDDWKKLTRDNAPRLPGDGRSRHALQKLALEYRDKKFANRRLAFVRAQ